MSVNEDQYNLDKIWETDLKTLLYPLQRRKVVSYSNTVKSNKPQNQKLEKELNITVNIVNTKSNNSRSWHILQF